MDYYNFCTFYDDQKIINAVVKAYDLEKRQCVKCYEKDYILKDYALICTKCKTKQAPIFKDTIFHNQKSRIVKKCYLLFLVTTKAEISCPAQARQMQVELSLFHSQKNASRKRALELNGDIQHLKLLKLLDFEKAINECNFNCSNYDKFLKMVKMLVINCYGNLDVEIDELLEDFQKQKIVVDIDFLKEILVSIKKVEKF